MATPCQKAQLALGVKDRVAEHQVLFAIVDLIGPCVAWPSWVAKIFWMTKLNNVNVMRLTTFLLGNGLPSHVIHQWLHVRGVTHDAKKLKSYEKAVLEAMKLSDEDVARAEEAGITQFFYFDLIRNEYCFANGTPRNYVEGIASIPFKATSTVERHMAQAASLPCSVCRNKIYQRWRHGGHKSTHVKCTKISVGNAER